MQGQGVDPRQQGNGARGNGLVGVGPSAVETELQSLRDALKAVKEGGFSIRFPVGTYGLVGEIANAFSDVVDLNSSMADEIVRVSKVVTEEGKLNEQASIGPVTGSWATSIESINAHNSGSAQSVAEVARVITAIAQGDLSKKMAVEIDGRPLRGEFLQIGTTVNTMVDQLNTFAGEVTRVAREVGTEGQLGGQAEVPGVAGTRKDLADSVNTMVSNLTAQVRDIANVVTAAANGDLGQKITVEVREEFLQLKDTINGMVDNLDVVIGDVNSVMALVGEGTLTRRIEAESAGEFASMTDGINATIEGLQRLVTELAEAALNIAAVSQNMLSTGQEINATVTQLSSSGEQIAGASRESEAVSQVASDTLARAEDLNQQSEAAGKAGAEGSKALAETVRNTDLMLEGSQESTARMESLSKSSGKIQEIINVIRDIATQTDILAINAAIEAVRAGKQGKGFAVVAEEVKTPSADSKEQARNIADLVQSVQQETQEAVETIKAMGENVGLVKASTEQTAQASESVNSAIESTSRTAREISEAATTQKQGIDTVSQSLDKISGIAGRYIDRCGAIGRGRRAPLGEDAGAYVHRDHPRRSVREPPTDSRALYHRRAGIGGTDARRGFGEEAEERGSKGLKENP